MKILGLCGGSGSGKSLVCKCFLKHGIVSIDADKVYHELVSSNSDCLVELTNEFGNSILTSGTLDRRELARIVFSDPSKLERLNQITHKHILGRIRNMITDYEEKGYNGVIVDAPLLFESGFDKECDFIACVCADKDIRVKRITSRDNISNEDALIRISKQIPDEILREKCNFVIENNGNDITELENVIDDIVKLIFDF